MEPQTVVEPCIEPKNCPLGSKKSKTTPKSSQSQMNETKKIKVVELYE